MKYDYLTDDQKRRIIEGRLRQLEAEHYQHTLNLARQEAIGGDQAEVASEGTRQALAAIESAHKAEAAELAKLPAAAKEAAGPGPRKRRPKAA